MENAFEVTEVEQKDVYKDMSKDVDQQGETERQDTDQKEGHRGSLHFDHQPILRERKVDPSGQAHGVGKRKSSVAKVWIKPGDGAIKINGKSLSEYFKREIYLADIIKPFQVSGNVFNVIGTATGGGSTGQAGAVRLAISRALVNFNPEFYPDLRALGLMTFDSRRVERKKCGLVKARKAKPTSRR